MTCDLTSLPHLPNLIIFIGKAEIPVWMASQQVPPDYKRKRPPVQLYRTHRIAVSSHPSKSYNCTFCQAVWGLMVEETNRYVAQTLSADTTNQIFAPRQQPSWISRQILPDKLVKVRPLLDIVLPSFLQIYWPGALEETSHRTRLKSNGRIGFKQYMPRNGNTFLCTSQKPGTLLCQELVHRVSAHVTTK